MLTVTDAFTGTAALGPEGRGALGQILACGPRRIERAPLGGLHDRSRRHQLRQVLVGAVADDGALLRLADATLADLAPGMSLLPDAQLGPHLCDARLLNLLVRQGVSRWSMLVGLRVGELRAWPGASTRAVAEIVGLAFERSLVGLASTQQEAGLAAAVDLAILLDHEQAGSRQPLLDALAGLSGEGQPEVVRRAAVRLLRTVPVAGHAEVLSDILAAAGGPRDLDVFVERTLTLRNRPTIDELAGRLGVSAERVRQIRARAEERVRASTAAAPEHVCALIGAVRGWLGRVVTVDVPDDMVRRLGAGSIHTRTGGLLLWLAGPYLPVPGRDGWLALDPVQSVARLTGWLSEDGGVRPAQEVRGELAADGVRAEHHDAWMAAGGAVMVEDMVVYAAGGLATVAERVLFAAGRGMTAGEIAGLAAAEDRVGELRGVLRRDKRFARAAADVYELAEWGPSARPETPAPIEVTTTPASTSTDEPWWLRVPVEADVLRGACRPVPVGLVDAMPLVAHDRRTFTSRYGPVTVLDDGAEPALGPLRHVALACGAQAGDELWLGFDLTGEVTVRLLRGDERSPASDGRSLADPRLVSVTARGAR